MPLGSLRATRPRGVVAVLAVLAVAAAGLAAGIAPASSQTANQCPAAYAGDLTGNQPVHGLTVSSGTAPGPFTGSYIGTLANGIAPGVDMILVQLSSPEIDKVGGIWQGMSGSPVYAEDGTLIGAVAYGLSYSPSPVAGLTPARYLEALATQRAGGTTPQRSHVALPARLRQRIVSAGAATTRQASEGMSRLRLPVVVSGVERARDRQRLIAAMGPEAGHVVTGTTSGSAPDLGPVVAGGNLAASLSSGTVTFAGLGTATLVCGHRVVGFGHPMTYQGRVSMGMHNADVLYVQADALGGSWKVANLGAVLGTVTGDHLTGIAGEQGPLPRATPVAALATFGSTTRNGLTDVYRQRYLPDIAASTLYAIQDRAFDHYGPGSSATSWTITGKRPDGSTFTVRRSDTYTSRSDISFKAPDELYDELNAIKKARPQQFDAVTTRSHLTARAGEYRIGGLALGSGGGWEPVAAGQELRLRAGTTARLRVQLTSTTLPAGHVIVRLGVPPRSAGASGELGIAGGASIATSLRGDLDQVLAAIEDKPHNVDVVATLDLRTGSGGAREQQRAVALHVVTGSRDNPVTVVR